MKINKIYNHNQYVEYAEKNAEEFKQRYLETLDLEQKHSDKDQQFSFNAFSITADKQLDLLVDWKYSDGTHINWREQLVCPETQLCNRLRASYHLMLKHLQTKPEDRVYITEQVTPLYRFLKQKFPQLIGSEFVDDDVENGCYTENHIRHEDLTALSFETNSLDKIFSFDVLEHVPNYKKALKECLRCLKPGGHVMMSFPFDCFMENNLVRARLLDDGTIEHLTEPEYHGDPVNDKGCLSFYTFGWQLLNEMRQLGFVDVYAACYWSKDYGYLGPEQISIIAKKSKVRGIIHAIKGMATKATYYLRS